MTALVSHQKTTASPRNIIQPKLMVNTPNDVYEQEADAVADRVMRMPLVSSKAQGTQGMLASSVQRKCAHCEEEEKKKMPIMRKAESGGGFETSSAFASQLSNTKGVGQAMPRETKSFMESRFGQDFSHVRLHTHGTAADMSAGIQAKAFTHGSDIYFNRGEFAPNTEGGKRLLAHELVHTIQQNSQFPNKKYLNVESEYLLLKHKSKTKKQPKNKTKKQPKACPNDIPQKDGFEVWSQCFTKKTDAAQLDKKFKEAHIESKIHELDKNQFGLYFKPMTKDDAEMAGAKSIELSPSFQVETKELKDLSSFTYSISCPNNYTELKGLFKLTHYETPNENDFPKTPTVDLPLCGTKKGETQSFRKDFIDKYKGNAPLGIRMEGAGISLDGKSVRLSKKNKTDCIEITNCILGNHNNCLVVGRSVAVDEKIIKIGSELLIEGIGVRTAEDKGDYIKGNHIDIYSDNKADRDKTIYNKKVCIKNEVPKPPS